METVLVVEDSAFFSSVISKSLTKSLGIATDVAPTLADARALLASGKKYPLALVDLVLPDGPRGEAVDAVAAAGVPSVVFSGVLSKELRQELFKKGVVDSVLKDSPASLDYVVSLVGRLLRNRDVTVMVAEDSDVVRGHVAHQLKGYLLNVLEAPDGKQALNLLAEKPEVRLLLTDYNMPRMDGFELIKTVRKDHSAEEMAIIGMSTKSDSDLSARFLKFGANDFIYKPFTSEELLCRITQNLNMLDMVERLKRAATVDFLTDLHNRRYFFDVGETLAANARRDTLTMTVAMMDIDFFKKVNDTHGHDAGDVVLKVVAGVLKEQMRDADIVARLGGEEFSVLAINMAPDKVFDVFDRVRAAVEAEHIEVDGTHIPVTISIGICNTLGPSLEAMLNTADECLYDAKEGGRNRVVIG